MALPRRIPKERNRSERWSSPAHRKWVGQHECCVPGCKARPIEVAHLRNGTDAAMGRKASDWYCISLCRDHHSEQHRIGEPGFQKAHNINMHELAAEFAKESPKRMEIRARAMGELIRLGQEMDDG